MLLRMTSAWQGLVVILTLTSFSGVRPLTDHHLSPELFYPFGTDVGDSIVPVNDDGSSGEIPIDIGFPFFATSNKNLFVNTNGVISFGEEVSNYTSSPFPLPNRMIAPYWCDVDTRKNNGRIYYRQSTDVNLLNRATKVVVDTFSDKGLSSFNAKWLLIATWHNVTYYGGNNATPTNTFQAVLTTDGTFSIAIFNYGRLTWTTGAATSSGGNASTGLGGIAAQAGFNAGDSVNFFALPGSQKGEILNAAHSWNSGLLGRWVFRVDSAKIESNKVVVATPSATETPEATTAATTATTTAEATTTEATTAAAATTTAATTTATTPTTPTTPTTTTQTTTPTATLTTTEAATTEEAPKEGAVEKTTTGYFNAEQEKLLLSSNGYYECSANIYNWIIIMQRTDGSLDFNRNWAEYRNGFGDRTRSNYWIGLELMSRITNEPGTEYELRVEVQAFISGILYYANYEQFSVGSESTNYTLTVNGYSGNAGDALTDASVANGNWYLSGMQFSTPDRDNDISSTRHCANEYKTGWWFADCWYALLTGEYGTGAFAWEVLKDSGLDQSTQIRFARMMIRRRF